MVTGTRAEYGLLRWVMDGIRSSPKLELQLAVTGMHLSPEFGLTWREIEADGFRIDAKVEMLMSSDTPVGIAKSTGVGIMGFADAFARLAPDLLLVLGDRFEILSAATAATLARIPIAHAHGGETSEGAVDESIRHSITKMSHVHFTAASEYRNRVIQLGERPDRTFNVGGFGIDNIHRLPMLDRQALEAATGIQFLERNLMVTFHPATLENATAGAQMQELLAALADLRDTAIVFTLPNADTDGRELIGMINEFVGRHGHAHAFTSLGQLRYLSCLRLVDGMVGNSSSGLIEMPSFRKGTVNIGDRQRGRLKASCVIDCVPERHAIAAAISRLYEPTFQSSLATVRNPYGEGGAAAQVVRVLEELELDGILKKHFHDLPAA